MQPKQRQQQILDFIRQHDQVSVEKLAQQIGASPETIRRDLTKLDGRGLIRKFHGGAATANLSPPGTDTEGSFQARMHLNTQAKRAIARCAAKLFRAGDTLFVDTGSTTILFAEELASIPAITVITNSGVVAQLVARGKDSRVFLLGGEYNRDAAENLGALTIEQISRFRCTHAVITVGAVEAIGVTDFDVNEAQIATAMVGQAQRVTVLADASKMGRSGLFTVCSLARIGRLVSEEAPPGPLANALEVAGTEVIVARQPQHDVETVPATQGSLRREAGRRRRIATKRGRG